MTTLWLLAFVVALPLFSQGTAHSQNIIGTTTIDIDPNSGAVTATCETNLDAYAQNY